MTANELPLLDGNQMIYGFTERPCAWGNTIMYFPLSRNRCAAYRVSDTPQLTMTPRYIEGRIADGLPGDVCVDVDGRFGRDEMHSHASMRGLRALTPCTFEEPDLSAFGELCKLQDAWWAFYDTHEQAEETRELLEHLRQGKIFVSRGMNPVSSLDIQKEIIRFFREYVMQDELYLVYRDAHHASLGVEKQ